MSRNPVEAQGAVQAAFTLRGAAAWDRVGGALERSNLLVFYEVVFVLAHGEHQNSALGRDLAQARDGDGEACRGESVKLGYYGAHDAPAIRKAFADGVTAFTTDRPDIAIAVRCELGTAG